MKSCPLTLQFLLLAVPLAGSEVVLRMPRPVSFEVSDPPAMTSDGWVEALPQGEASPWWFGGAVVLQTSPGEAAESWLRGRIELGWKVRSVRSDLAVVETGDPMLALRTAELWGRLPEILAAVPESRQPAGAGDAYAAAPGDTFFPARFANVSGQWYLENRDPADGRSLGVDINVRAAWPWSRGVGVTVAVADVGIELAHPELQTALAGAPHRNFAVPASSADPLQGGATGAHGTSIAGLIAATPGNGAGMSGAAPGAKVASWVVFDARGRLVSDTVLSTVYRHADGVVGVQNHSWGTGGDVPAGPGVLEAAALDSSLDEGRGGLGAVHVRIAGNRRTLGGNANDDAWGNDPRAIQVAAVRLDGRVASYSNPGASILVSAPSGDDDTGGLFTTDLTGFAGANLLGFLPPFEDLGDFRFNSLGMTGTSAAAPLVSSTVALMLSARPGLSSRDVRTILALTAVQWDPADPGLSTNAAGLRFSHNSGFGVVDAGEAVRLALAWRSLGPATRVEVASTAVQAVEDDTLRVEVQAEGLPLGLERIRSLPGSGAHPDQPTGWVPLVDLGRAEAPVAANLAGAGALIERGGTNYATKLGNAAAAGAAFAVVRNHASGPTNGCPVGDALCPIGGIEFVPIPAVFVAASDGAALAAWIATHPETRVRLATRPTVVRFEVAASLRCETVRLRLRTDHPLRGDLRITLVSPAGTRSVLQAYNADESPGPVDWTYTTRAPFLECTAGTWTLEVTDEGQGAVGSILGASLALEGVPLDDTDHDGLSDSWEREHFGGLSEGPGGDSDADGWSHLRESLAGTDPGKSDRPSVPSIGDWNPGFVRVTVPATPSAPRAVLAGMRPDVLDERAELESTGAVRTRILPLGTNGTRFVRAVSPP
jgi:subtilisin-like proprotein convertase family protein